MTRHYDSYAVGQPMDSKILVPGGFINMADVEIGMDIFGENGDIYKVYRIYPKGRKTIYTLTFEDGSIVKCSNDHLWSVIAYDKDTKKFSSPLVLSSVQIRRYNKYTYYVPGVNIGKIKYGRRKIVSIEAGNQRICQCIMTTNPSSLYITDGYIPTHNFNFVANRGECIGFI